jgi:hypothetical protein
VKIQAWQGRNRTPRACVNAIIDLEAVPGCLPKADSDSRLRAVNHTYRRRLAAFEALCGLTEPAGFLELRSGK